MADSEAIVTSQINPSPPELSTPFAQDTATEGGSVGVGGSVGGSVGGRVGGSVTMGELVGGAVGRWVGAAEGRAVRLGAGLDVDRTNEGSADPTGCVTTGRDGASVVNAGSGVAAADRGDGEPIAVAGPIGVPVVVAHCGPPTRIIPDVIPPSHVVTTIATKGPR